MTYVIYHANCPDGFAACYAASSHLKDDVNYVALSYGKETAEWWEQQQRNLVGKEVYVLDFSLPTHMMKWLFANANVVWIDHHKTSIEMFDTDTLSIFRRAGHIIILDDSQCGSMLTYQWFNDGEVPLLYRLIDDYDRWQFKLPQTEAFNAWLNSVRPWSFSQWEDFLHNTSKYASYCSEGEAILRARKVYAGIILQDATECVLHVNGTDIRGKAANCPKFLASIVGHELATESGTFGLAWHENAKGDICCSIRGTGTIDVSAIAQAYGGGGHHNAAGFTLKAQCSIFSR